MSDWVCSNCSATNPDAVGSCPACGIPRGSGANPFRADAPANPPDAGMPALATPAGPTVATPAGPRVAAPAFEPVVPGGAGLLGGVVGGLVAAIAASAIWYAVVVLTEWQVGLVAVAVGWLIGQGVVFGAEGRGSLPLAVVSGALTVVALAVSEYLIVFHFVSQALGGGISVIQPVDFMAEVVIDSLSADPVTLLFWGIALFAAASIPFRKIQSG